jgi:hypothetical protein
MKGSVDTRPTWVSWAGPVAVLAAAAVAAAWLWQTHGAYVSFRPAVGLVMLMATLGVFWLSRVRAAYRFFAALDTYADQELARTAISDEDEGGLVRRSA